ncbi:MAG: tRNA preQ1(34) S-adenosylmethionine ribosyltransferase-isomerase QueA [Rhodothermales bacterium]
MHRTSDYDYDLPADQIAQHPAERRDQSRLLVIDRESGERTHRLFSDLVAYVRPGDVLVVNETRVFPARLRGRRSGGGEAEVLLLHPGEDESLWTALVRPGTKMRPGRVIDVSPEMSVEVVEVLPSGERVVRLRSALAVEDALARYGEMPLPPYMKREVTEDDRDRYQTVYARERGSVAAPTAGLHFTPELIERLQEAGVELARLVLHVGVGTFRPVEVDDPADHPMHKEWYRVPPEAADAVNAARARGSAVWAVGTTTVRTLESVADEHGRVHAGSGWTDIFIQSPYRFRAVDRLITNFHLPRSTLLMLVAAFAGYELTMETYRDAVARGYRFYSYGDAMALL